MNLTDVETAVSTLGQAKIASPLRRRNDGAERIVFVKDTDRILLDVAAESVTGKAQYDQ